MASVITIDSLSKTYKLYHNHRDRIKELLHPLRKGYHRDYHALKDISMTIGRGEVIGIVGQNGSGKSTLLKILSSVVTPSSGSFNCRGRVTALLELGGGFNKDISGVENIYFLGGIQGFTKKEMQQRLQEILDFADVGLYADQPVNNYSSGMYVRLAFSMAININPDILIIDEALAVGDIRFQQKCFRKIREFKDAGKTILFCSHNLGAVRDFCTRAIWLHNGEIVEQGDPVFVTDCYNAFMLTKDTSLFTKKQVTGKLEHNLKFARLESTEISQLKDWDDINHNDSYGTGGAKIEHAALYDVSTKRKISTFAGGENVRVYIQLVAFQKLEQPGILMILNGRSGMPVFKITNYLYSQKILFEINKPLIISVDFRFPVIGNGKYTLSVGILNITNEVRSEIHRIHDAVILEVYNPDNKFKQGSILVIEKVDFNVITDIKS